MLKKIKLQDAVGTQLAHDIHEDQAAAGCAKTAPSVPIPIAPLARAAEGIGPTAADQFYH